MFRVIHPNSKAAKLIDQLRVHRLKAGLKQGELGRLAGYHANTISFWECGDHTPSITDIINYANALGFEITLCASLKPTK